MYAPAYGYGPAHPNQFNGALSQSQQPHNPHPHHQQQPLQQPQHMMFNPQYAAPGAGPHQSPYAAAGAMAANAGAMAMNGMAHVSPYQTPYSSSPYGGNMPASTAPNLPPNFMPTTSGAPSFPMMNAPNMNPQNQAQRMQPPPPSSTPSQPAPRSSPFPGAQHNTPPSSIPAQSQFSTPQAQNQTQSQTPNNNQQAQAGTILTPQTPNFPPGSQPGNSGSNLATPLSPGSETRERERVTVLLEINKFLLMEVMRLQAAQAEAKKEEAAASQSPEGTDKEKAEKEKEKVEKIKPSSRDYLECMRRLQSNLAYLAAIADRSHKPSSQIPPHPAIMTAPNLTPRSSQSNSIISGSPKADVVKKEEPEEVKIEGLDDDRSEALKEQYKKLQALFPGVDPKKEPPAQNPAAVRAQAQQQAVQMMAKQQGTQGQGQGQGQTVDPNAQQKLQNDMLRQRMMQAQQAQQAQQQQNTQPQQQQMSQGGVPVMNPQQQGQVQTR